MTDAPSAVALQVVDELAGAEATSTTSSERGADGGSVAGITALVARRLADPAWDEVGTALLCLAAVRVTARGEGNPFAEFLEADEPVIELFQWYRTQQDPGAARRLAARCIDQLCPDLASEEHP